MSDNKSALCFFFAVMVLFQGCGPKPQASTFVVRAERPEIGRIESLMVASNDRWLSHQGRVELDLGVEVQLAVGVEAAVLHAQLGDGAIDARDVQAGRNVFHLKLERPDLLAPEMSLRLWLSSKASQGVAERSEVVELLLPIGGPQAAGGSLSVDHGLGPIEKIEELDDGRFLLLGQRDLMLLDPRQMAIPQGIETFCEERPKLAFVGPFNERVVLQCGEKLVDIDLSRGEIHASLSIPGLVGLLEDANPRYLLVVLDSGEIKRYYLRDAEWSQYKGELASPPLVFEGELLAGSGHGRVVLWTENGEACVFRDQREVEGHCVALPEQPLWLGVMPWGAVDLGWDEPSKKRRRSRRKRREVKAPEAPWGVVLARFKDGSLAAFSADNKGKELWRINLQDGRSHELLSPFLPGATPLAYWPQRAAQAKLLGMEAPRLRIEGAEAGELDLLSRQWEAFAAEPTVFGQQSHPVIGSEELFSLRQGDELLIVNAAGEVRAWSVAAPAGEVLVSDDYWVAVDGSQIRLAPLATVTHKEVAK